jgi:hypothetical protein
MMIKVLLVTTTIMSVVSFVSAQGTFDTYVEKKSDAPRLCKVFTEKAKLYKKDMRDDSYAKATLNAYNKRAEKFCAKAKAEEEKKEK